MMGILFFAKRQKGKNRMCYVSWFKKYGKVWVILAIIATALNTGLEMLLLHLQF